MTKTAIDLRKTMGPAVFSVLARRLGYFPYGSTKPVHGAGSAVAKHIGAHRNFGPEMRKGLAGTNRLAEICHEHQVHLTLVNGVFQIHPAMEYEIVDRSGNHVQFLSGDPGLPCGSKYGDTWRFVHHPVGMRL